MRRQAFILVVSSRTQGRNHEAYASAWKPAQVYARAAGIKEEHAYAKLLVEEEAESVIV
jgi:hypothetical protein